MLGHYAKTGLAWAYAGCVDTQLIQRRERIKNGRMHTSEEK